MRYLLVLLLGFGSLSWMPAQASQYVYLNPPFTVNFGSIGKLKYLRTEIALKVDSEEAAEKIRAHMPYLRNDLILLFSAQEPEIINTPQGRESLRQVALDNLRSRMLELEDELLIEALYFSNFVVQN